MTPAVPCPRGESSADRLWLVAACGIALLALALRLHDLGEHSLWGDEAHTARRAESLRAVAIERKLAPLYAATRTAFLIGKDEWAIRLPHVLYGSAGVLLMAFAGRVFVGPRVGLVAAILLAVSPFHVFHSRDARHYSLFVLLTLVSMLLVRKAVETRRASWTLAFLGSGLIGFHDHAFAIIPFAAHAIWGLLEILRARRDGAPARGPGLRAAALLGALAAMALALYFLNPRLWRAAGSWMGGDQERRFDVSLDTLRLILAWLGGGAGLSACLHALLFAAGLISLARRGLPAARLIAVTAITTAAALLLVEGIGPTHPFRVRYTIFLLPAYLLGVSAGLCLAADLLRRAAGKLLPAHAGGSRDRWAGAAVSHAVPVLALVAFTIPGLLWSFEYRSADYRLAVEHLARRMAPGDLLALPPYRAERHFAGLRWYLSRRLPEREKDAVVVRTPGDVDALLEAGKRVWLVGLSPSDLDPAEADPGLVPRLEEGFEDVAHTPPGRYSAALGPPDREEELVIRVSRRN